MSEATTNYTNAAQQRILALVLHMFGDVAHGYRPAVLARAFDVSPSVITRDLANLAQAGLAERVEASGCWRLTSRLPNQAAKVFSTAAATARQADQLTRQFQHFN